VHDEAGLSGQNSVNPASIFSNHAVVKIDNMLYDPSYGVTYAYAADNKLGVFESDALAGYARVVSIGMGMNARYYVLFSSVPGGRADDRLTLTPVTVALGN
jgi:hypothetical protein